MTQAILVEGRNLVRIHVPEGPPPSGFEAASVTLEDAYMTLVNASEREGGQGAESGHRAPAATGPGA